MPSWLDALAVRGFSSAANREILNQTVATVPQARILEIGSFKGSTAVAMCHGNDVQSIHMIDNHSEFGDTRAELQANCDRFGLPAIIHNLDWFASLPEGVFGGTTFNVYLYDGSHAQADHARELSVAWPHLADEFLYIVDDYSWPEVRSGCEAGIVAAGDRLTIKSSSVYESKVTNDAYGYWNGLLVARCEKRG